MEITEQERQSLEMVVNRRYSTPAEVRRAKVILLCAAGHNNLEVSRRTGVCSHSVGQWRKCFLKGGVAALEKLRIQGPARRIDDEKVTEIIRLTLDSAPVQRNHWSTRSLAKKSGISHASIARIWDIFGLKPHPQEGFQLSSDPFFVEKVRGVAGLYMSPPQNALALCVNERSGNGTYERFERSIPCSSGATDPTEPTHYRQGALSLFAALAVQTGGVHAERHVRHSHRDFLGFLRELEARTPKHFDLHVALDNYATDQTLQVHEWLSSQPRWHLHLIPTRLGWLSQVERLLEKIVRQTARHDESCGVEALRAAMLDYLDAPSSGSGSFSWHAPKAPSSGQAKNLFAAQAADRSDLRPPPEAATR